jgi:hypothetical protein
VLSGGFGLKSGYYELNVGGSWQRGILAGAKGFTVAVTNYIAAF